MILIALLCLSSCSGKAKQEKYKDQLQVVEVLIRSFAKNDVAEVKKLIGTDLANIGLNDELLTFRVKKMHDYLTDYEVSKERSFEFKEYPETDPLSVDISIPFKSKTKGGQQISILVTFAKYIERGKILNFTIVD